MIFSFDFKSSLIFNSNKPKLEAIEEVANFLKLLLSKLKKENISRKDSTSFSLLLLCFSEFLPLDHELFSEMIPFSFQLTSQENIGISNMGKTFLFRILNRFIIQTKRTVEKIPNTPCKRNFSDFMSYRHLGGEVDPKTGVPVSAVLTSKLDNYFYPIKELKKVTIENLSE